MFKERKLQVRNKTLKETRLIDFVLSEKVKNPHTVLKGQTKVINKMLISQSE